MNWKQFLKPNWRKIVIMIIIIATPFFISPLVGRNLDSLFSLFFRPFTIIDRMIIMPSTHNFGMNNGIIEIASGVFEIIDATYAYVITCIIILIYDILKKSRLK